MDNDMPHNLHIFVNSVEFIAKAIDLAKLTPEQVKVVCSVSGDNGESNQRKLGKDYPIGQPSAPARKINFYTSTCFEGCDIYDENGVTFIVSDGNKSHTLLDISTLFTQICGRLRDSKYKGEIIHVYSTTKYSREVTLDEFVASTKKVLAEATSYADEINSLSDTARGKTLSKIKYINEQYVRVEDNRLVVDKNLANMDIVNPSIYFDVPTGLSIISYNKVPPAYRQIGRVTDYIRFVQNKMAIARSMSFCTITWRSHFSIGLSLTN